MTQDFGFALWGEDEDHEDEQLWALCEAAENLFADRPAPTRRRYELLGCELEGTFANGLGFLAVTALDQHGEGHWDGWYLADVRVLGTRPCARDLSLVDVAIEAVRGHQTADHPHRRPLSVGLRLSDAEYEVLGHCRDLAEADPPEEPAPHAVRLLGCAVSGPLRDVLEGRRRQLAYRRLQALDTAGGRLAEVGHPDIVDWRPSTRGPGLYDLTVHMDPLPPVTVDIWELWQDGIPERPNLWARFDRLGRDHWLGPALDHRQWQRPDRPAGTTFHLDGRHVTDEAGFFCALGEAVNGPGGYFGRSLDGVADALCGRFGATLPFTLVWHDHEVARRSLGVQPLTWRPATFEELLAFLRNEGIEVVLA
ncbi:barstar family protein [Streptomyces sp. NPDC059385]|uniref:barstar family protein n=1 Tax=Streptomyces sp. NPDC059385 TaxID=3346817 RepID=UPI00367E4C4A